MKPAKDWWIAAPALVLAFALWGIETLLPDLLHVPDLWAWRLVIACALAAAAAATVKTITRLRERHPGPWLARPTWRSGRWLRERPRLSIVAAAAEARFDISTLEALTVHLTVWRSAAPTRRPCTISFDDAVLVLTQGDRTWRLRPVDSGGFLSEPVPPGRSDAVMVVFAAIRVPLASSQAPDLNRAYTLRLRDDEVILQGRRPVRGLAPSAEWSSLPLDPLGVRAPAPTA